MLCVSFATQMQQHMAIKGLSVANCNAIPDKLCSAVTLVCVLFLLAVAVLSSDEYERQLASLQTLLSTTKASKDHATGMPVV